MSNKLSKPRSRRGVTRDHQHAMLDVLFSSGGFFFRGIFKKENREYTKNNLCEQKDLRTFYCPL